MLLITSDTKKTKHKNRHDTENLHVKVQDSTTRGSGGLYHSPGFNFNLK